jgi:hypothetical protein
MLEISFSKICSICSICSVPFFVIRFLFYSFVSSILWKYQSFFLILLIFTCMINMQTFAAPASEPASGNLLERGGSKGFIK